MYRRTEEEVGPPSHRHFVGFFNVPVQEPTRTHSFYGYSVKPPHFSRLFRCAWGYGGYILIFNPWVPTGTIERKNAHFALYIMQTFVLCSCLIDHAGKQHKYVCPIK